MAYEILAFFSSRSRHTRYWRDWSSDVCSSDLGLPSVRVPVLSKARAFRRPAASRAAPPLTKMPRREAAPIPEDRKSVGWGKRVDLGGRRIIKKKEQI